MQNICQVHVHYNSFFLLQSFHLLLLFKDPFLRRLNFKVTGDKQLNILTELQSVQHEVSSLCF